MTFSEDHVAHAYGTDAAEALRTLSGLLEGLFQRHSAQVAEQLRAAATHDAVLRHLTDDERREFEEREAHHVLLLASAQLTQAEHEAAALEIGRSHALVGADMLWRMEAFCRLQEATVRIISASLADPVVREHATRAISSRIFLDIQYRISSYRRVDDGVSAAIARIDSVAIETTNLPDLVHGMLAALESLDGDLCGLFARSGPDARLQVEATIGERAAKYHEAIETSGAPSISSVATDEAMLSPIQRAWSTGRIVVVPSWAAEATLGSWRELGSAIGFRSGAAIPLLDRAGKSIALFNLYSTWPGFFLSRRIRYFVTHAQKILSHGLQLHPQTRVIPLRDQRQHVDLLRRRRVQMHFQPVVDLRSGQIAKFEALARLERDDGAFIAPGEFLPAFGCEELLNLFEQGLQQALQSHTQFEALGLRVHIGLNFPPEGFVDPRYEEVLFSTLAASEVDPCWLVLEILESADLGANNDRTQAFLARLRDAGVRIAQDDLGSGHSSLLRLEQFAFDAVKIDQGLVRGAMAEPKHALEFILHLTRLSHARNLPVTVEGLENEGLVEAATLLGADFGQGYAFARPMPGTEVVPWAKRHVHAPRTGAVTTALGAMAGYILWDMEFATIEKWPQLREEFLALPCAVDQFIEHNQLRGGLLDRTLHQCRAIAMSGAHSDLYHRARSRVLDILRQHWQGQL